MAGPAELPPGSAPYYVVRFARPEHRPQLSAAFAFAAELERAVARCSDQGATRLKLDWWRKALAEAGQSAHPLIQRLRPLAAEPDGLAAMWAMLDATETDVIKQQAPDVDAFIAHCQQAGRLADLLCLASGGRCDAGPLGSYAAAVYRVQGMGRQLQRGHNPLPRDLPPPSNQPAEADHVLADSCRALLEPLRTSAELALQDRARDTLPARRWASQARALHRLLERENYPVQQQHLDITPLAKLWAAWRVR